jgi:hypothetical protein
MIYSFLNSTEMMTILIFGLILFGHVASAAEPPHPHGSEGATPAPTISVHACRSAMSGELAQKGKPTPDNSMSDSPGFEGVQIETADITLYELFFETILQAQRVQTMEHPQIDRLRGYCYRDVLIVVRQDLKSARPTGWVQINYAVADVVTVQQELEQSYRASPIAQRNETERNKIVRFRLKPDVRRGNCRAVRLEVAGPEGFMIGFDQFKTGSCKTNESQSEAHD